MSGITYGVRDGAPLSRELNNFEKMNNEARQMKCTSGPFDSRGRVGLDDVARLDNASSFSVAVLRDHVPKN